MDYLRQHAMPKTILISVLLIALVGALDHLTGYELGFFVFYFVPISYAAWTSGRWAGGIVSVVCTLVWLFIDLNSGHAYPSPWLGAWNAAIRLLSFLTITFTVSRVKELWDAEKELSAQLQTSLSQVKELQGLLPICASCKKIRNDTGYWEQIELYLIEHSNVEFTHGLCPECSKRLYPEVLGSEQPTVNSEQ
jgi:hypothetical protein